MKNCVTVKMERPIACWKCPFSCTVGDYYCCKITDNHDELYEKRYIDDCPFTNQTEISI